MNVGWSNPCFEIWLMSYFQLPKNIEDSQKCCESFEKIFKENTGKKYKKSEADLESQLRDVSMYQTYKNTKILNEKKSFSEALSKEEFEKILEENNFFI